MNNLDFNNYQNRELLLQASKNGFDLLPFEEVILDDSRNFNSIKKKEIEHEGKLPVIDQGEGYITGYTNQFDEFQMNNPRIVFGDHTRILKFVDFPFVKGADGTKILKNKKKDSNLKYFYYYLKSIDIPNDGYSRHFKYIKNLIYPIPNYQTQNKIVEILNSAQKIILQRNKQLQELDNLSQSIFYNEFNNINKKYETTLGKAFKISSGATPSRKESSYWEDGEIPWVKSTSVNGSRVSEADEYITQLGFENSSTKLFPKDTVLIAMYGQGKTRGQVGILDFETTTNQACAGLEPIEEINMDFIFYQLKSQYKQLRGLGRGGNQKNLSITVLKDFEILLPPIELQNEFAEKVKEIELVKEKMQISLDEMNTLFDALMQKAFTGELV